jgi:membrane-associated phospholipid phosphatase
MSHLLSLGSIDFKTFTIFWGASAVPKGQTKFLTEVLYSSLKTAVSIWFLIGLILSLLTTYIIVNILKKIVAQPRPNFYALCNYYNYNNSFNLNNFTNYNLLTMQNKIGSIKNCNTTTENINNAFGSFPSYHSSLIFTSLTLILPNLYSYIWIYQFDH